MIKFTIPALLFLFISSFCNKKMCEINEDVPTSPIAISCINMQYIKGLTVISDDSAYKKFLIESNASNLLGSACDGYVPPIINFNVYHLILIHSSSGGCEKPEISKYFIYNNQTELYEYDLVFTQKGICKKNQNFFESVLVKKTDIDVSRLTFSSKTIMPERENR